jgi:hypothetical protein
MGKEIKNPVTLVVELQFEDGGAKVLGSSANYPIAYSEYPADPDRDRSCPLIYNSEQEQSILNFATNVVKPQIEAHEEVS